MTVNVGSIDRTLRIVAGLALVGLAFAGIVGPWGYIGVVPILTGFIGVCPAYSLMNFNTCSSRKA